MCRVSTPHEYKEKPGACKACGNSPVNHMLQYIASTGEVLLADFWHWLIGTRGFSPWIRRLKTNIERRTNASNFKMFAAMRMIRYSDVVDKASSYRSQVIWEEAQRRGIVMQQAVFLGKYTDSYRAKLPQGWIYFDSIPVPPQLHQDSYLWIDDKMLLKRELEGAGVPVPAYASVWREREAREAFARIGAPVVVKPRNGSRGRHTTTGVYTEGDLVQAFHSAREIGAFVSIERYLSGSVCRATCIGGKLVGFFQADPPRVVGDGHSTIAQLIESKNASKPDRVQDIVLTDEHRAFMKRQGYAPESVLESEKRLDLSHRTGRLFGGETRELLASVHPKLRAYAERAARHLDVPVVGFDLIIENPEEDPDTQEWGIIEANSLPFIDLHYLPLYGIPSNPAAQVWGLWG